MYTTKEAARALGVQPVTVWRWVNRPFEGQTPLKAQKRNLRGDLAIREDDLVAFAEANGIALNLPQDS